MPQRKVNVITERRIFGDDNDLPRDIRDMKSGGSGDLLPKIFCHRLDNTLGKEIRIDVAYYE